MLSKIIAAPFVLAIIVCGYLAYTNPYAYSWYLLPPVLAIAVILIMRPQIDWYWYQKMLTQNFLIPMEDNPFQLHEKRRFRRTRLMQT